MDILIEELDGHIWTVALKRGVIEGLEIDPPNEAVRWGSVYWARVMRIDAALDAAFLDLDGDEVGIIYNRDVRYRNKGGGVEKGGSKAIGKVLKAGDMVAVQAKTAHLVRSEGAELLEDKNAQMSMDITIPGRYLVYCVFKKENVISSRIRGKKLRQQMKDMIESIDDIKGFILRAAAADMQTEILSREASILKEVWKKMSEYMVGDEPTLIALGPDSIQRTLGDKANQPIDRIEIVTMDHFTQIEDWCSVFAPDLVVKIKPIEVDDATQDLSLLYHRDVMGRIKALFQDYVMLKSGGSVIIQETAALTAIDVNKGGDKRSNLAVNIEALKEISRQMRLRNVGGIVIIDFLTVQGKGDEKALMKELSDEVFQDPCTVQIHGMTKLGLMEVTRKRRTPSLHNQFASVDF